MGQQASVTLNTVVYSPAGTKDGISRWMDRSAGVAAGFSSLTQKFTDATASGSSASNRVEYRLKVPVVATTDTACVCAGGLLRSSSVDVRFILDANATQAERTDLYLRVKDLIAAQLLIDSVEDLDPAYG